MVIKDLQEPENTAQVAEDSILITEQDRFQLDSIAKISLITIVCAGVCVGLAVIFIMLMPIRSPETVYFKATDAGQLIQDVPLDKPNLPLNLLLNWVAENTMTMNTFNYIDYAGIIENAHEYFTTDGYDSYLAALRTNGILEQVLNKKFVLRAVPSSAPQVTKEGILANFYLWKIKIPMLFRYRNFDTDITDDVEITLLIVRVPTTEAPFGIRILKYDLEVKSVR